MALFKVTAKNRANVVMTNGVEYLPVGYSITVRCDWPMDFNALREALSRELGSTVTTIGQSDWDWIQM